MGIIIDTSVLIASERRRESITDLLRKMQSSFGDIELAISAVTVVELTHGIYRVRNDGERARRSAYVEGVFATLIVYPLNLEIGRLAGKIEGEAAARGIAIAFEDLTIGATALSLNFEVATLNLKHFEQIPGLRLHSL